LRCNKRSTRALRRDDHEVDPGPTPAFDEFVAALKKAEAAG
jgi:hypothetical protein